MITRPITVRLKKEIYDLIESGMKNTGIFTTIPDFILYSMKNEYIGLIESIKEGDIKDFIQNVAQYNYAFNSYKGDIYQTIIRVPIKMYNDLMIVLNTMMLSITDFIRSSIMSELSYEIYGFNFDTIVFDYNESLNEGTSFDMRIINKRKKPRRSADKPE